VRGLYDPHAHPFTRIVHGLATSWDPSIVATRFPNNVFAAAWSPCSRSIAISWDGHPPTVEILDAATLMRTTILEPPTGGAWYFNHKLIFSPDGGLLTWFCDMGSDRGELISWDLQTGVRVSAISAEDLPRYDPSPITYSACGTMLGVLSCGLGNTTINTYNVLSGTHIYSHSVVKGSVSDRIWTHGECIRFATMTPESITTWEVGFTSAHAPAEVETLSIPDGCHNPDSFLVHPTFSRLALAHKRSVRVWDTQDSKFLLGPTRVVQVYGMSFSLDGHFFACNGVIPEGGSAAIHLWKESHTGYVLHRRLPSNLGAGRPFISPDGRSVIAISTFAIQLWQTMDSTTSPSTISAPTSESDDDCFVIGFSPDETLAAVVRKRDETVTVLDLKSGIPRLTIDTGMEVYGLGVTGSSIVVVSDENIVTWNLPAGDRIPNLRVNVTDSVRTATFSHNYFHDDPPCPAISTSPDLHRIAVAETTTDYDDGTLVSGLCLYDVPTGQQLDTATAYQNESSFPIPWFTPDGREVWCVGDEGEVDRWELVEDTESDATELEYLGSTTHLPDGFPRESPRGYQVVDGRWILSPGGKRLFWLPPEWRSHEWRRMWDKRFLALLHDELPEAVILELE